ncbi:MAG: ThuA domain-containing protein [Bryobacteraceae bacterium]|jgi:type 1 glutamine amidotransferase
MNATRTLFLATLGVAILSGQGKAPPGPPKIQVLIITGQNGHDWRGTTPVLKKELEDTGKFEVRVNEEFRGAGPETLAPYDVVVVNYMERGQAQLRWGERADNAFLDYVRSGKGVVLYHFTLAAFTGWTEFEKMSAGNWRAGNGHHSARHDFTVDIKDANHPILKGLMTPLRVQNEELYSNLKWQPEGTYHVLATAYDDHSLYDEKASDARNKQPMSGPGVNEPILWTTEYGKGRVFVTALGHDADTTSEPTFKVTFTRGTEWAATGKVTIPVPAEMAGK